MTPPRALVRALALHDPNLKLRWARASKQWFIDEKMPPRHPDFLAELKPPRNIPVAFDRYESLQAGYYPRFTIPKDAVHRTDEVMASLRVWDASVQGSMAAINRAMDDAQAIWEAEQERKRRALVSEWMEARF